MVSFLTDTVVCGFSLYHILAYFLIYSCIGWCLEVIYAAATTGQLVNRGFLNGPVCPIYGFGMIIVLFALTPRSEEHTSELQSPAMISYAVFCLKKKRSYRTYSRRYDSRG